MVSVWTRCSRRLSDPSRRSLLDSLNRRNGQTLQRALHRARHGPAVGEQAPRRARGGEPRDHRATRPREAPLRQRRADQRHRRSMDQPLRPSAGRSARRPQDRTGAQPHDNSDHRNSGDRVRLHHLHQDNARATLAGAHRPRVHGSLLGRRVDLRLEGRLDDHLGVQRRHDGRSRADGARRRCESPSRLHLAHDHARVRRAHR